MLFVEIIASEKTILTYSPDLLIKTICNAVLNVERGEVVLTKKQKCILGKHRSQISKLSWRKISIPKKR